MSTLPSHLPQGALAATLYLACLGTAGCEATGSDSSDDAAGDSPTDTNTHPPDETGTDTVGTDTTGSSEPTLRIPELGPVPPLPEWPDNPPTAAKRDLGHILFSDPRLSSSRTVSCGSCHSPVAHFQSNTPRDLPARSLPDLEPPLPRHTPSLLNLVYAKTLHWDGSESDLVESMVLPFAEANQNLTDIPREDVWSLDVPTAQVRLKDRLTQEIPGYVALFQDAFATDIREITPAELWDLAGKALAVFIRVAVSRDAPFDRWNAGDDTAISAEARAGLDLFMGKGRCIACHSGPMFTDYDFHNLSLVRTDDDGQVIDEGRARVTGLAADFGRFLTPSLRHVTKTSPFFHDGAEVALVNVIAHHTSEAARVDPNYDPILDDVEPFTAEDLEHMVAFLKTLSGAPLDLDGLDTPPPLPE